MSLMVPEQCKEVSNPEQFVHGGVLFLWLSVNVGVSGNVVIGSE